MEHLFEQISPILRRPQLHLRIARELYLDGDLFTELDTDVPNEGEMRAIESVGDA